LAGSDARLSSLGGGNEMTVEEIIALFTNKVFDDRPNSYWLRAATPMIPFIAYGLQKTGAQFEVKTARILRFRPPGTFPWFVARYEHRYHGFSFRETNGRGQMVNLFRSMADARAFYDSPIIVLAPSILQQRAA